MIASTAALAADDTSLASFGNDPWWIILIKTVLIFLVLVLLTLFNIWWERRVVARMQHRIGPNVNGPFGLLQSLADGVKLALKEDLIPKAADKAVFLLAPVLAVVPAFVTFSVIPFGPEVTLLRRDDPAAADRHAGRRAVRDGDRLDRHLRHRARRLVQRVDVPLLGGLRSSAQMISYEVAMGLALVAVFLVRRLDVDLRDRGRAGQPVVRPDPRAVVHHLHDRHGGGDQPGAVRPPRGRGRAGRRLPHRVPSLKFALFFLAEYINMATVSALATTLFLGGWHAPFWIDHALRRLSTRATGRCCGSSARSWSFVFVFIWLRGSLPRLRYDQFMAFGWKRLIPAALLWIIAVATIRADLARATASTGSTS